MKRLILLIFIIHCASAAKLTKACESTPTTVVGTHAPTSFCSGDLIFEDNFNTFNANIWKHAVTMAGGGNYEFQWVVNDRENTFAADGKLNIRPTLTSDKFGEAFVTSGTVEIPEWECTDASNWGCKKTGTPSNPIPPIRSGRIHTYESFGFKYGTVEIRAKGPAGDWIGAALWLQPIKSIYGTWPASGEIDMMEMKGNLDLWDPQKNIQVGAEHMGSTLNYGPRWDINGWSSTTASRNRQPGFNEDYHLYRMVWTPDRLQFFVDNASLLTVTPGAGGFWERGGFGWTGLPNPWINGTKMAPFDNEFGIILSHGVGGTSVFSDNFVNGNGAKPWVNNNGRRAMADFNIGKNQWLPGWNLHTNQSHLQVDYVRVWAL